MKKYILASKESSATTVLLNLLRGNNDELWHHVYNDVMLNDIINNDFTNVNAIYFFHWSWLVKSDVLKKFNCIGFHTANLPDGRGGTPLQNQIALGIINSKLNALILTDKLDAGDILCSHDVSLQGTLYDIWNMLAITAYKLISNINKSDSYINGIKQGEPSFSFKRICGTSLNLKNVNISHVYDQIRMHDCADSSLNYAKAKLIVDDYELSFSRASIRDGRLIADVEFKKI